MKFLATSAAVLLAAISTASATTVTFYGAGPNSDSYTLSPTFQGANFTIGMSPPNLVHLPLQCIDVHSHRQPTKRLFHQRRLQRRRLHL